MEEIFTQLKTTIEAEKKQAAAELEAQREANERLLLANEQLQEDLQKCKSRLDQDQLNFKYSTLLETYNEAEYENTKLRNENKTLTEQQQICQGQYDQMRSQCIEALNENRQLRLRLSQPFEKFTFVPPPTLHGGLNRVMFLKDL